MSMRGMEKRKFHMAILAFIFVLAAAPLVWSGEANKPVSKQPASADTGIMAHYEMMGHTEEALNASRQNDLQGATKHAQMALRAGESVQGVLDRAKVDPEKQKEINRRYSIVKRRLEVGTVPGFKRL